MAFDEVDFDSLEFDENPEWTEADFARARLANEALPAHMVRQLVRSDGWPKAIIDVLRAEGAGLARSGFGAFSLSKAA